MLVTRIKVLYHNLTAFTIATEKDQKLLMYDNPQGQAKGLAIRHC